MSDLTNLTIQESIYKGSFSQAYYAIEKKDNKQVTVLKIHGKKLNEGQLDNIKYEVGCLKQQKHFNVAHLLDLFSGSNHCCIVFEHFKGKSLNSYLKLKKYPREESIIRSLFIQIIAGLKFLHDIKIPHQNLNSQTIMVDDSTSELCVKLFEFGLGFKYCKGYHSLSTAESQFIPPEVLDNRYVDYYKVDIWACGVILHLLTTDLYPNFDANSLILPKLEEKCSSLITFLVKLLSLNPKERPSCNDIIYYEWISQIESVDEDKLTEIYAISKPYEEEAMYKFLLDNPQTVLFENKRQNDSNLDVIKSIDNKLTVKTCCVGNKDIILPIVLNELLLQGHAYQDIGDLSFKCKHLCSSDYTEFEWSLHLIAVISLPMYKLKFCYDSGDEICFKLKIDVLTEALNKKLNLVTRFSNSDSMAINIS